MSPSLRFDLARLVAGETLFAIPLITVMEDSFKGFVSYALFLMKPLCILRSEKVCRSGGPGTEMFFLVDGECDLLNSETNQGRIVGENAVFEQYSLMAHANEIYRTVSTVTAVSKKCVLYSLTIQDFRYVAQLLQYQNLTDGSADILSRILEDVSPAVSTYFLSQLAAVLIDDDLFALTPQQQVNVERALRNGRAFRAVAEQHEKARLSTVSNVALAKLTAPRRRGSEWAPDLLPRALKRMDTGNVGAKGDAIPTSMTQMS
jgi:CRP-like cAMP-binding protein